MSRTIATLLAGACCLSACQGAQAPEQTPTPAVVVQASASDQAKALAAAGLPVSSVRVVSDASDDNHLLGRPNQYTSKVFFYDLRHPKVGDDTEGENTIEVFTTPEDAKSRHDYIAQMSSSMPVFSQYQFLHDKTLLRLSKALLPAEAEAYRKALSNTVS